MSEELYPITYWLVAFFGCIFVIGSVANSAVAFASYHEGNLRNACNILVALCCLSDAIHLCGHTTLIYAFSTGNLYMNSLTCFWLQLIPLIGQNAGYAFPVAIGIDRVYACSDPIGYTMKNARVYLASHIFGVSLYVCFQMYHIFVNLYPMDVVCMIPAAYMGPAREICWNVALSCFVVDVILYAIAGIRIKTSSIIDDEVRLFKSLLIILVALIFGHIGTMVTANIFIANVKNPDFKTSVVMDLIFGIPVNISIASNYLVYYATSSEYRRAFRAQFAYLSGKKTTVRVIGSNSMSTVSRN